LHEHLRMLSASLGPHAGAGVVSWAPLREQWRAKLS
jgi:hypothetical protein